MRYSLKFCIKLSKLQVSEADKTGPDLSPESQISSPGRPAPVKFDNFNTAASAVATDPSIACPKPLRLSPDSPYLHESSDESRGKNYS